MINQEEFILLKEYVTNQTRGICFEDHFKQHIASRLSFARQKNKPSDLFLNLVTGYATYEELANFLTTLKPDDSILQLATPYIEQYIEEMQKAWSNSDATTWFKMYIFYISFFKNEFFSSINNLKTTQIDEFYLDGEKKLFFNSNNNKSITIFDAKISVTFKFIENNVEKYKQSILFDIENIGNISNSTIEHSDDIKRKLILNYSALLINSVFQYFTYSRQVVLDNIFVAGTFEKEIEAHNIFCPVFSSDPSLIEDDFLIDVQIMSQYDLYYHTARNLMFGFTDGKIEINDNGLMIKNC